MAAATFCTMSHGYGVNKLNEYLLNRRNINRQVSLFFFIFLLEFDFTVWTLFIAIALSHHTWILIHQVLSLPDTGQWALCTRTCFNKTAIRQLHSEGVHHGILLKCRAELTESSIEEEKQERISTATLIWRAIKLPIYTVALVPITVGSAAAYFQTGQYFGKRYLMLVVSSVFIIAWLNLSNDVYDFDTGADKNKKESVVNLVGSVRHFASVTWDLESLYASQHLVHSRPQHFTGFREGRGCLLFSLPDCIQELTPVTDFCYDDRELSLSSTILSSSILVGFTTSLILFCSHFHQIDDDKAVGKRSPLVRLGTEGGAKVVKVAVGLLYSLLFILGLGQTLPFSAVVLGALTLPMGKLVVRFVEENHREKRKIFMAKYYCVRLHTVFGGALAAGLVAARFFARKQLPHAIILSP
ncbi:UNVERIFIED_CONTAM: 2-carboxy-1,4-naphthoquinone phytyltransferase, chloroplastic [Sesamum latifolium]|uniref:2-carboxy-1,4-naphthoquinone phytyltransferase, chloroplastic n=1 Tax=Sesamum latifolium TaxID=2727402 RepID=A0AAW2V247_9LAMI